MIRFICACFLFATTTVLAADRAGDHLRQPDAWFRSEAAGERLANLLTYQDQYGCWPKNVDTTVKPFEGKQDLLHGTFDNSATVNELRLLARAYVVTNEKKYKEAFDLGINCILESQYKNGGWPQSPQPKGYSEHITFNDGTMIGLMTFLREVFEQDRYEFVSPHVRQQAREAFERGVQCILDCQINFGGKLTVWCAQHDKNSLEPRGARSYEHPSLSGGESAGVVCLLMSLDKPSGEIQKSIRAAVEWYEHSKLTGIRFDKQDGDRRIHRDEGAPPLWARFYEIETNRPIFSGRNGVIKYDISEIEAERRNGYSWYVTSGKRVNDSWSRWKWK